MLIKTSIQTNFDTRSVRVKWIDCTTHTHKQQKTVGIAVISVIHPDYCVYLRVLAKFYNFIDYSRNVSITSIVDRFKYEFCYPTHHHTVNSSLFYAPFCINSQHKLKYLRGTIALMLNTETITQRMNEPNRPRCCGS